jgi:outer membrane protein
MLFFVSHFSFARSVSRITRFLMNTPPPFMLSRSSRRLSALAFFFALLLAAAPVAQAQQAGYITEQAVLSQMPEMQKAQKQLQQQVQSERQQLQQKQQQLRQRMQKFQNESNMLSEQTRKERRSQLQKQQQQLQQQMQKLRQQIAQQERELLRPVIDKYRGAVEAVAQERGLDFVITEQALVYTDDAEMADVTQAVASRLGVEVQEDAGGQVNPDDLPVGGGSGR